MVALPCVFDSLLDSINNLNSSKVLLFAFLGFDRLMKSNYIFETLTWINVSCERKINWNSCDQVWLNEDCTPKVLFEWTAKKFQNLFKCISAFHSSALYWPSICMSQSILRSAAFIVCTRVPPCLMFPWHTSCRGHANLEAVRGKRRPRQKY